MSQKVGKNNNKVYRLVLTGGPCGGKTTGQARLFTFFENLGWKVYRVPETATVLLGGGVKWSELAESEAFHFQENLIKTMMQIEDTFFDLATACSHNCLVICDRGIMDATAFYRFQENLIKTMMQIEDTFFELASSCSQNCLVICDRGTMDATAYMKPGQWDKMKVVNTWNDVEIRDNRYNQVIHMVSAAKGAEDFYRTDNNCTRHENLDLARTLDDYAAQAWVGHPYYDVIDNTTDFEAKVVRMIATVCNRLGIDAGDRLSIDSKKRKFLVASLPKDLDIKACVSVSQLNVTDENGCPLTNSYLQFQDFIVVHDYLVTPNSKMQARIRRRGQNVRWDSESGTWDLDTDCHDNRIDYPDNKAVEDGLNESGQHTENQYQVSKIFLTEEDPRNPKLFMYGTDQDFSNWTYTHTIRRPEINKESPETKMQISSREYELLVAQRDSRHYTIYKKRRCFLWNSQYFQMDIYEEPCHPRCAGLIILETYTTQKGDDLKLPDFLNIVKEITGCSQYSMYNLSKMDSSELENGQVKATLKNSPSQEIHKVTSDVDKLGIVSNGSC